MTRRRLDEVEINTNHKDNVRDFNRLKNEYCNLGIVICCSLVNRFLRDTNNFEMNPPTTEHWLYDEMYENVKESDFVVLHISEIFVTFDKEKKKQPEIDFLIIFAERVNIDC